MTPKQFDSRWRQELAYAEKALFEDGIVHPLYAVVGGDGVTIPVAANFEDGQAKDRSLSVVRLLAVASNAIAVIHRAEAWIVAGDLADGISPSQSDRRREVLVVTAQARLKGKTVQRFSLREIERGDDGRPVALRGLQLPLSDGNLEGPMADLLPPLALIAEQRALAAALPGRMQERSGEPPHAA